jgi:hypothetical protein
MRFVAALAAIILWSGVAHAQNPIAPTPPCPDSSNRIATTAFVKNCGGGGGGVTGSGTVNTLPIWTGTTVLGNSDISETGTAFGETLVFGPAATDNGNGFKLTAPNIESVNPAGLVNFYLNTFGTSITPSALVSLYSAEGTQSSPTAILSGDEVGFIGAYGYTGSGSFPGGWVNAGNIRFTAKSNFNGSPTSQVEVFNANNQHFSLEANGGFLVGSPTGGSQGTGTINTTGCFINGVPCKGLTLVTDGSNFVANATTLTFSGATVSGSTPNAVVTISGGGSGLVIGSTTITSGTSGRIEYNNSGILGELALGSTITSSGGILSCTTATTSQLGCVSPDGTIITDTAGVITVPKATGSVFGVVEPDGTTITSNAGVITALAGAPSLFADPRNFGSAYSPVRPFSQICSGLFNVNDGTHDDAPAINAALATGLPVVIPYPGCKIVTTVQPQLNGWRIFGFGGGGQYNYGGGIGIGTLPQIFVPNAAVSTLTNNAVIDVNGRDGGMLDHLTMIDNYAGNGTVAVANSQGICCGLPQAFTDVSYVSFVNFSNGIGDSMTGGGSFTVSSGTYNSGTGAVSITTAAPHGISVGQTFGIAYLTGTGTNLGYLAGGGLVATAGTTGTTLNYTAATGLGSITITGGPGGFGCTPTGTFVDVLQMRVENSHFINGCYGIYGNLSDTIISNNYFGSNDAQAIATGIGEGIFTQITDNKIEYNGIGNRFGPQNESAGMYLPGMYFEITNNNFDFNGGICLILGSSTAYSGQHDKLIGNHCNRYGNGGPYADSCAYVIEQFTYLDAFGNSAESTGAPQWVVCFKGASSSYRVVWSASDGSNQLTNYTVAYFRFDAPVIDHSFDVINVIHEVTDASASQFALPTSCSGLVTGSLWNNAGTVSVCP